MFSQISVGYRHHSGLNREIAMHKLLVLITAFLFTTMAHAQSSFKTDQLAFERVKTAYADQWENIDKQLIAAGMHAPFQIYLAAFKKEKQLELWIKGAGALEYRLFRTYAFCASSGILGPKLKEGDKQTPEGFYHINVFNPESKFFLSLGINYPNSVDLFRSGNENPGGDIYIHGKCETVGCIPLTDEKIKEVYALAVEAKAAGQDAIPVHIFPFRMSDQNLNAEVKFCPEQKQFWQNLQSVYTWFSKKKNLPVILEGSGKYQIQ
ncbi:L,D-transpeptidase-like protein [Pedobacter duraquae]|uniref:L,D-transpeptidase-like protein n=2 Tax=Pedobacter duraquae TaxID=425511 RepID=A0A4R6IIN6_9SPHI|nr:L,D-transpeptidase-like protein [Pedobacter duraquae]